MGRRRKNGEGALRQRKDGRWEGRVIVGKDNQGNYTVKSVYGRTREECEEKLLSLKKEHGIYTEHLTPDMLFGAWLEYWYKYHCKTNIRQTTRGHYERAIRLHIIPKIGDIPLSELTQSILQKFYLEEKQSGRLVHVEAFGEGLSDTLKVNLTKSLTHLKEKQKSR